MLGSGDDNYFLSGAGSKCACFRSFPSTVMHEKIKKKKKKIML